MLCFHDDKLETIDFFVTVLSQISYSSTSQVTSFNQAEIDTITPMFSSSNDAQEVKQWERFCKMILDQLIYGEPVSLPLPAHLQQHYIATQWTVTQGWS